MVGWLAVTAAASPSRRSVLRAGLLTPVALTACTSVGDDPAAPAAAPHPDVVLADEAALREQRLLAAYDAAAALVPTLAERLLPLRAEHAEHLAALGVPELPAPAPADPSAAPTPVAPTAPPLPADPPALLAALADLERSASTAHADACVRAGRGLAVVLASAAASEASHPVALR